MKFVKIAGLCLASMLMMGMALAGSASAAEVPLWLLCLPWTNNPTRYEDSSCTKASATGKWESVAIGTKSDTVRIVAFSLRLEDAKGELGAAVKVKCNQVGGGIGLIEGRNLLLVRKAVAPSPKTECEAEGTGIFKACKTSSLETVEGAHLPWAVEVYGDTEGGKTFFSRIQPTGEGGGQPGWKVRCAANEDNCVSETGKLEETSGSSGVVTSGVLLVLAKFKESFPGECSIGGAKQGHVAGQVAILLSTGLGLSVAL